MLDTDTMIDEIKNFIIEELKKRSPGHTFEAQDEHFIESGIIDSFGFLELISAIEQKFKIQLNFTSVDPTEIMTVSGLSFHSAQCIDSTDS